MPETRYAKSGDVNIAYQVMGDGPLDVVIVPGIVSHVEYFHELPGYTRFLEHLAAFARVITFDKRGNGLSDPVVGVPGLEERMDDVRAVMDAVGSERAAMFAWSEGSPMAALFAATYPERTVALVLYASFATFVPKLDSPGALAPDLLDLALSADVSERWGHGETLALSSPSAAGDEEWLTKYAKFERLSASPGAMRALIDMNLLDPLAELAWTTPASLREPISRQFAMMVFALIGVLGVAYLLVAADPTRNRGLVLTAAIGKSAVLAIGVYYSWGFATPWLLVPAAGITFFTVAFWWFLVSTRDLGCY